MDNECPGCIECEEECDVWHGVHLWTSFCRNKDGTGEYDKCEFCGEERELNA